MINRRGAAAVELALVLPIFLVTLLAMLEIGNMIRVKNIATNLAREAARAAVKHEATHEGTLKILEEAVKGTAHEHQFSLVVTPDPAQVERGEPITATVTLCLRQRTSNNETEPPKPFLFSREYVTATTVMCKE
jgi:Flp pilus assembly protein TadG